MTRAGHAGVPAHCLELQATCLRLQSDSGTNADVRAVAEFSRHQDLRPLGRYRYSRYGLAGKVSRLVGRRVDAGRFLVRAVYAASISIGCPDEKKINPPVGQRRCLSGFVLALGEDAGDRAPLERLLIR